MSRHLLRSRRFAPLFLCQALSAFNDTFMKTAMVFLVIAMMPERQSGPLIQIAGALFMAPSFILSGLGGQWADRYDKALMARRLKLAEFTCTGIAALGFFLSSLPLLFLALLGFGVISALFGPVKYGILPDLLATRDIPAGNALVEGTTFLAVIGGTFAGGLWAPAQAAAGDGRLWICGILAALAATCWLTSLLIPRTGEADPTLKIETNVLASTKHLLAYLWNDARLWRGGIAVSLFWLAGATVMALLPGLVMQTLGGQSGVFNVYLAVFAAGIGLGSALASWLLHGRILLLPVPLAAVLLGLFAGDLGLAVLSATPHAPAQGIVAFFHDARAWRIGFDLLGLSASGGLFIVPAFAAVQIWAAPGHRARVVAAVNILSAVFMVGASIVVALLQLAGLPTSGIFLLLGGLSLIAAAWVFKALPFNPLRDLAALVFRILYGLEVHGLNHLRDAPPGAIIVMNHTSFIDAAALYAVLDHGPVFAIDTFISQQWWVKPFRKFVETVPLDPSSPLATRALIQTARSGQTLAIFPEGRITRTGSLMKIYDGAAMIAVRSGLPVVPVRIHGAEPTPFSYLSETQVRRRLFSKITINILAPRTLTVPEGLRGKANRRAAGASLQKIMSDLMFETTPIERTVFEASVAAAREHGSNHVAMEDPISGALTYKRLLIGARVLGRKLGALAPKGGAIGVMLPSSIGAAVTILGISSAGRVPAMVNFTAGLGAIKAAGTIAAFDTIVTSRAFIAKGRFETLLAGLEKSFALVYLEDIRATASPWDKLDGLFNRNKPLAKRLPNDPAAILFTSGSEGTPKGVVLSHRNMLANAAQAKAVVDFGRSDKLFNVLPVFHAFGLSLGLILPLVHGVPVYLYPSPLHYRIIPELIYASNATILFGTDTFLTGYARAAHAYDFRSLRYVFAGAEPVRPATRAVWAEKFGLRILEGYGVTEGSPVVALNTPMANQFGSVGQLLPGIEGRLDPVEGITDGGRLAVRGPNIMLGYLEADAEGPIQSLEDGWYDTGDIASFDANGFLTIKGRAKRFAKIAGEMVSLAAVDALAHALWPDALSASTVLQDARRGERIVLVTQQSHAARSDFAAFARSRGAGELLVPAEIVAATAIPLLGSGKTDFAALKQLVEEREREKEAAA